MLKKLGKLRVGDAFRCWGDVFIAIALTPDPFEVYCLRVSSHDIVKIEEAEEVELLDGWELVENSEDKAIGQRFQTLKAKGMKLEVLY